MRKLYKLILLFLASLFATSAKAYDFSATCNSGHTLYYTITSTEEPYTVNIVSENSSSPYYTTNPTGNLVFPESVVHNGVTYSVTSIGDYAFSECTGLTSVTIPTTITAFNYWSFYNCSGLTSVYYNGSLEEWCAINFSNEANPLRSAGRLYINNELITDLVIPSTVTEVKARAFNGLSTTSLTIHALVTSIGEWAFQECSNLQSIIVDSNNPVYDSRDNCNAIIETATNTLIVGCRNTVIPNSVTSIGKNAFLWCTGLTSIIIPDSVTSIGAYAFYGCSSLSSITFGSGITSIENYAFSMTPWLNNQPEGLLYVGPCCIGYQGTPSGEVSIQEGTLYITQSAFVSKSGITNLIIPNSVISIGERAFYGCGMETVTIGESVDSLGYLSFYNCPNLTTVNYNAINCVSVGKYSTSPFERCSSLTTLNIGEKVKNIPSYLFKECSSLTGNLIIPDSVTNIGSYAFSNCSGLTGDLIIPDSVTNISSMAFSNCSGLTTVTVGRSVINIDGFWGCSGLTTINFNATNCTEARFYNSASLTNLNIGENVTNIPEYTFYECANLSGTLQIPDSVTNIGNRAFYNCSGFDNIVLGNQIESVGYGAFSGCSGLTEITIPSTVTSIGSSAFSDCSNLTTVNFNATNCAAMNSSSPTFDGCSLFTTLNIGENVTNIPDYAFRACDNITDIYANSNTPSSLGYGVFTSSAYNSATVWTPCPAASTYRSDSQWGQFTNIQNEQTSIYNIAVQTADANMGDVTGDGSFTCDTEVELTATPNDGYRFLSWNDGNEDNPRTITVGGDSTFVASFRAIHTITATAGTGGTISPSGELTLDEGSNQSFIITPDPRYLIASVMVDGQDVTNQLVDGVYTFTNVVADHTIAATFEEVPYIISVSSSEHGTITPSTDVTIYEGESQMFTVAPDDCYKIAVVRVDGVAVRLDENNSYTFENVTTDHTIDVTFEILTYTISVTANEFGSVTHDGNEGDAVVNCGSNQSFVITPETYCRIVNVIADGQDVTSQLVDGVYTFANVTADHTIAATFEIITYTIEASANNDEFGSILGGGTYNAGSEISLTATPNENYHFVSWNDGNTDNPRTFTVTRDSTFVATFARNQCTITVIASNSNFGTVTGNGTYFVGDTVELTATPNIGYCFISWDDDSIANPRSFVAVGDITFIAEFSATVHRAVDTTVTSYFSADNHTFYVSGAYSYVIPSDIGCDTIVDLMLQVLDEPEAYDISPNPAKSLISISSEDYISLVEIYSTTGMLVMQKEINANRVEVNIEWLVPGVYFVRLFCEEGGQPVVQKFIKE